MKRPREIGSLWMSRDMEFLHGPRFAQPKGRIFIQGRANWHSPWLPGKPRYKMMIPVPGAQPLIQSILRPTTKKEAAKLIRLAKWNGQEYEFPGLKISPYLKIDNKTYTFYTIAFDKKSLNHLISYIKTRNNYRAIIITHRGIKIYKLYKRKKGETT